MRIHDEQGSDVEKNPVKEAFGLVWFYGEPTQFRLHGAEQERWKK